MNESSNCQHLALITITIIDIINITITIHRLAGQFSVIQIRMYTYTYIYTLHIHKHTHVYLHIYTHLSICVENFFTGSLGTYVKELSLKSQVLSLGREQLIRADKGNRRSP